MDLILTYIRNTSVKPAVDIRLQQDRHHPALEIDFEVSSSSDSTSGRWKRDLKNCNLDNVLSWIQNTPFPLPDENIEHVFVNFCQRLEEVVVESSPLKFVGNSNLPRWFSKELKQLVVKKKILHRTFKSTQMEEDYISFSGIRRECRELAKRFYSDYNTNFNSTISNHIKVF